jgi:hypothetical protein
VRRSEEFGASDKAVTVRYQMLTGFADDDTEQAGNTQDPRRGMA